MEKKRIIGLGLFIIGIGIFFLNPLGILTGFAIAENVSFSSNWALYFSGLVLMAVGGMIIRSVDEVAEELDNSSNFQRMWEGKNKKETIRLGSRGDNTAKNKEAKYVMTQYFIRENNRLPNQEELKGYMRIHHEEINSLIREYQKITYPNKRDKAA